ncbi:MAG TPA: glycosyltransferase family 39 protein [Ktedonobacteraceae bacterium]|nr:glycosyltransferase family 39 protein [Ktedonobacteraceae bacterium]
MSTIESTLPPETLPRSSRWHTIRHTLRGWLTTWDIYPILLVSCFLHYYQLGITEFDVDQAVLFGMARNAVLHGLLPATSNLGSLNTAHLPAAVFLFMLPAAISSNPLGGAILVATLNVLADLLTYVFVRRYFGRVAGIVAALLFATAAAPLGYSRFIWQPTMLAPFTVLFFFALFWGVVERRNGWLLPALLLLGILAQLHEEMALLAIPLLLAVLFAPETIRRRDVVYGLLALLVLFSTYIAWMIATHFHDVTVLLSVSKKPAYFDPLLFTYYRDFFSPYNALAIPSDPHTLVYKLLPILLWLRRFMLILVIGGFVTALVRILLGSPLFAQIISRKGVMMSETREGQAPTASKASPWLRVWQWWRAILPSPLACGLILLLVWQVVFVLALARHSRTVPIVFHYLLALMPGSFMLVGVFIGSLAGWLRTQAQWWRHTHFALYLFMSLLLVAQFAGSTAGILDQVSQQNQVVANHHSLSSLQRAFNTADLLARQQHLSHVYVSSDFYTQSALEYLAALMQTPTTVFDGARCIVLPNPADGPAILLVGPNDALTPALFAHYSSVQALPGQDVAPFHLYIVRSAQSTFAFGADQTFTHELHSLDGQLQRINAGNGEFLTAWWSILKSEPAAYGTTYHYGFVASISKGSGLPAQNIGSQCTLSAIRTGDEMVVAFPIAVNTIIPALVSVAAQFHIEQPVPLTLGPLHLETFSTAWVSHYALRTTRGGSSVTLQA